ncbi:MAG: hypothetical protein LRY40_06405 [Shewanella fodinae]|nr:hypothetical protein [Shewanella fodinae]
MNVRRFINPYIAAVDFILAISSTYKDQSAIQVNTSNSPNVVTNYFQTLPVLFQYIRDMETYGRLQRPRLTELGSELLVEAIDFVLLTPAKFAELASARTKMGTSYNLALHLRDRIYPELAHCSFDDAFRIAMMSVLPKLNSKDIQLAPSDAECIAEIFIWSPVYA